MVRQALTFCEHIVRRGEAEVTLALADELPRVHAIRAQLHQVLINLITNAIHALAPAGRARDHRHARSSTAGARCRSRVADSGVGIGALDRDARVRAVLHDEERWKGNWLGLSIVKNIVEGHGGQVRFESEVGMGTTFFLTLPIQKETIAV